MISKINMTTIRLYSKIKPTKVMQLLESKDNFLYLYTNDELLFFN